MQSKWYGAPWSNLLKFITYGILLLLGIGAFITPPPASLIIALILLGSSLLVVRGYSVGNGRVAVHSLFWKKSWDVTRLTSVKALPYAPAGSIRLFGNGGLFSSLGYFQHPELGRFLAFYTDPANAVVMTFLDQSVVVLSPKNPEEFVTAVEDEYTRVTRKSNTH